MPVASHHRARLVALVAAVSVMPIVGGCSTGLAQADRHPTDHVDAVIADEAAAGRQDRPVRVSVIGDSFSAGSRNGVVWPDLLAAEHGIVVNNASLGGAGYVSGDEYLGTFADQVAFATEEDPTVILVVGSENDVDADPQEVQDNAADLYAALEERSPDARIVVIGPIWSGGDVTDTMWDVDAAVAAAAAAAGLEYIDTLADGWLSDPGIIQDDGDHPTDEGQFLLAGDIDDALSEADPHLLD